MFIDNFSMSDFLDLGTMKLAILLNSNVIKKTLHGLVFSYTIFGKIHGFGLMRRKDQILFPYKIFMKGLLFFIAH